MGGLPPISVCNTTFLLISAITNSGGGSPEYGGDGFGKHDLGLHSFCLVTSCLGSHEVLKESMIQIGLEITRSKVD